MAQKGVQLDTESISCSICLDVLKDPVTIPCGHSYCKSCIKAHFDGEDQKGLHSCPQCRERFIPRPVLVRNTMLAALVEQLKKTGLQAAPADHCYAGPEDVACDFCSGRKLRASKSCLSCVASYCEEHLQPHYDVAPLKKHKLVEPSKKLQENICSVHDEVKKLFCRTDQKSICYLCSVEEHKGHHTVSAAAERTERQRELEGRRQQIQQRIQDKQKNVDLLQQEVEAIDQSADKTVEDSEKMFAELIRLIQNRRSDVEQQVRSQQQTAVRGVKELQQELQQEITELQRKDAELQQLSHTEDHIQFLTSCPSLPALGESTHSSSIRERPLRYFEDVTAAVSELTDKLQHILTQDWTKVSLAAAQPDVLLPPEPESRADFLRCSRRITLDQNTASEWLLLSEGNRKVRSMKKHQSYPYHPDRFNEWCQVLSRESLTGRCYWEVEWTGRGVTVAVAYKNIYRKGHESGFGLNDKSWALYCRGNRSTFRFNSIETSLSAPLSSRVGVYLDHRAGILSFYSVSETRTLLHRVQTTFTQPLYAGLWVYSGSSAELCELRYRQPFCQSLSELTDRFCSGESLTVKRFLTAEMAQKGVQLDTETFSCSICLEVLKDPVTIPCGHSYCMSCIKAHFDGEDQKGLHSCPQCRERFIPRPVLVRNTMLADLVEQLKKTGLQAAPADHCYAGPEDVACDFCSGRKLRASKSCLSCVASYCEEHLQPHYDVAPLKKHKLVKPSKKLQENICSVHDEVKKLFCRTDQKSICSLCSVEEHKGHHTVSAAAERTERQRELEGRRQQIQQRIQDTQKNVKLLQQEVEAIDQSADKTVEDSEKMFAELIHLILKKRSDAEQQVRSQQQTAVRGVKELQQELQQEITELQRKDAELQQLSHTEDHIQFLTSCPSLPALRESTHSSSIRERPLSCFEDVTAAVSELTDRLQHILTQDWTKVSLAAAQPDVLLPPEPESRADFLRCSRRITLDPNTAHSWLLLSEGNRKVTVMRKPQSYPDHPDRFTGWCQVLSRESLSGRCYWEVEWRGGRGVIVAVAYKNISRAGNECRFGYNDKSWALYCDGNSPTFRFNSIETSLSAPRSSRVGVYLDHRAGILSFYSVSETRTLLHRVQTTFTQPLYAGVGLYGLPFLSPGSSAELCELR
ncbi:uncharacterized protein ACNS7B_017302 [Menidia menidia]